MAIPTKKLKNGFEMPVFGLGTWKMGGEYIANPFSDYKQDVAAIATAINLGVTHIDTAEIYAMGNAEKLVARAIKNYSRKKIFLASKVSPLLHNYKGIKPALKNSLKRLDTEYLDLYYVHRYPGDLEKWIAAMNDLVDDGLVRNIAISNFNLEHTKRAQEISKHPIVATQVHYNLQFRDPEVTGLLEYCQKNDILLVAWRPVGKGNLAVRGIPVLDEMCKKYNKTPAQIAINWLISQTNVVTLAKSSNIDHLKENLGALGWQMDAADVERLDKEFPNQQTVSDVVPLG